jgi:phosphatidylcholine synthase
MKRPDRATRLRVILGWCVHFYTATGLLLAAWIVHILMQTPLTAADVRLCFLLMFGATLVDATDGTFARMVKIKQTIPSFDGRRLDDLVDFLMYACLPFLLIERSGILGDHTWCLLPALIASAYGFCQTNIKTPDGSFVGFPSYWNIVAFYVYVFDAPVPVAVGLILFFAVMTFVPTHYSYPTQPGKLNRIMLFLGIPWSLALLGAILLPWETTRSELPSIVTGLAWGSFVYPAVYLGFAWSSHFRGRTVSDSISPQRH